MTDQERALILQVVDSFIEHLARANMLESDFTEEIAELKAARDKVRRAGK